MAGTKRVDRVTRLVESLTVPDPWDVTAFVDSVAAARKKAIRVIPSPNLDGVSLPCGVWVGRESDDLILYAERTSRYHAEQIIMHELGHMLLGHGGHAGADGRRGVGELLPDLDVDTVRQVLGRSAFDTEQEREAELFASLVMSQRRHPARSGLLATFLGH